MLSGLSVLNLELTSKCNKRCWMCGRRKIERDYPHLANWGDMDYEMAQRVSSQTPSGVVVQFHDNGEPLLYPRLGEALSLFSNQIRCLDTNGKLLIDKAEEIIGNLDTITISTFEGDGEADEQCETLVRFLEIKGDRKPRVIVRCLGEVELGRYRELDCLIATRVLHNPMGSFGYKRRTTVPEIGICLDALSHLVIKRDGKVSMCVRFDPEGLGIIGDATTASLGEIWRGKQRRQWLGYHIEGRRDLIPLCSRCEFWGVPVG